MWAILKRIARTTFRISRRPSHLCVIVQDCGQGRHFYSDETRALRPGSQMPCSRPLQEYRIFDARPEALRGSSPPAAGPTARLQRKSTVCGLNGFLPSARADGCLHLNPRSPKVFGALAPTPFYRRGQTATHVSVLETKIAPCSFFSPKRNPPDSGERRGEHRTNGPIPRAASRAAG